MSKCELKKETFIGQQELELKKIERRTGKESNNEYYMLFFNMCVAFDEEDIRKNRFIDVPFYASEDFLKDNFKGQKPKDLIDKKYMLEIEFEPKIRTFEGKKFADFTANIISMVQLDDVL